MKPFRGFAGTIGRFVVTLLLAVIDLLNRIGDLLLWLFVRPHAGVAWRPVSGTERIWLAYNRLHPFVIQHVVEGRLAEGAELDVDRLQQALNRVADSQPGMRVRLRGARAWLHWIADGPKPRVRVVSGVDWDGNSPDGASFLDQPLDPVRGPVAEVVVVKGDSRGQSYVRFVFRVLHAVTDGAGSMLFVEGFFTALREEKLTEVSAGPPIDADVGRKFCPSKVPPMETPGPALIPFDFSLGGGGAGLRNSKGRSACRCRSQPDSRRRADVAGSGGEAAWVRVRIAGDVEKAAARVGIALAESAPAPIDKATVRYALPVDMRRLAKIPPSSANLTGLIRVGLAGQLKSDDPVKALHDEIIRTLARREFGADSVRANRFLRWVALKRLSRRALRRAKSAPSKGATSAALSYLGGLKIADFSGRGFCATSVFSIPPNVPFGRLFLGMVQTDAALEIVAHQPGSSSMSEPLRDLMIGVAQRLNGFTGD